MPLSHFGEEAWRPLAKALVAFVEGDRGAVLTVHSDEGVPDPMPVSVFFRDTKGMRPTDLKALELARGRVLDAGAGVGSVSLALQQQGASVTAVEVIPEAVRIMVQRGVGDARLGRIEDLPRERGFDTVLLLMNGTALAGTLAGVPALLRTLDALVSEGGQILVDSTDVLEDDGRSEGGGWRPGEDYPGEVHYQLEFRGERGAPFPQLFLDPDTLRVAAAEGGWRTEVVLAGESGEYLARLTRSEKEAVPET